MTSKDWQAPFVGPNKNIYIREESNLKFVDFSDFWSQLTVCDRPCGDCILYRDMRVGGTMGLNKKHSYTR